MIRNFFFCRFYSSRIHAYLDSELPPRWRRRVASHLDRCPACYGVYAQERALRRELQEALPLVGRQHTPDFGSLWSAVRAELPQRQRPRKFRYGLVMTMLLLALAVPFTMGNGHPTRALPVQPVPQTYPATETPENAEVAPAATMIASSTQSGQQIQELTPPTQPEPNR